MDQFISKKELEKEHEVVINLDKLARVMKAKTPDEMKEALQRKPKMRTTEPNEEGHSAEKRELAGKVVEKGKEESGQMAELREIKEEIIAKIKGGESKENKEGKSEATKEEQLKQTEKEKLVVKKLFGKLDKGEQVEPNEKMIRGSFKTNWIYRPAPIQRNIFSKDFAYKEKDEEYNIW